MPSLGISSVGNANIMVSGGNVAGNSTRSVGKEKSQGVVKGAGTGAAVAGRGCNHCFCMD